MVQATVRRDGSSVFGPGNKWGVFLLSRQVGMLLTKSLWVADPSGLII